MNLPQMPALERGLSMPHVMALRSPRIEQMLTEEAAALQAKVDILETRNAEQAKLIELQSMRAIALATHGASAGDHLWLALSHAGHAVSTSASYVCSSLCPFSLCDPTASRGRMQKVSTDDKGAPPALEKQGTRGLDDGLVETPAPPDPLRSPGQGSRRNKLIPAWSTAAERHLQSASNAWQRKSTVELAPSPNTADQLENHEYILEEEWGHVPTNGVVNPKVKWKEA